MQLLFQAFTLLTFCKTILLFFSSLFVSPFNSLFWLASSLLPNSPCWIFSRLNSWPNFDFYFSLSLGNIIQFHDLKYQIRIFDSGHVV